MFPDRRRRVLASVGVHGRSDLRFGAVEDAFAAKIGAGEGRTIVKHVFNLSAVVEVLTGTALVLAPTLVVDLLFGRELDPTGTVLARVAGIALLSLGVSASESPRRSPGQAPRIGICIYNVGATAVLVMAATMGAMSGPLLWPAVVLHGLIGVSVVCVMLAPTQKSFEK